MTNSCNCKGGHLICDDMGWVSLEKVDVAEVPGHDFAVLFGKLAEVFDNALEGLKRQHSETDALSHARLPRI